MERQTDAKTQEDLTKSLYVDAGPCSSSEVLKIAHVEGHRRGAIQDPADRCALQHGQNGKSSSDRVVDPS